MSQQKDEEFYGSLPALNKASAILHIRASRPIRVSRIVNICFAAIENYHLEELVKRAKEPDGVRSLKESEKDSLCAGLIKLGEALTFCKDGDNVFLRETGITRIAGLCVDARNYFVHHHMYHSHLNWYNEAQRCIDKLPLIDVIKEKLGALQSCSLEKLVKQIGKGQNDFPFEYKTFVACLKAEFTKLEAILATSTFDEITSNVMLRASLENRVRNILSIMVDLIDKDSMNKNLREECSAEKAAAVKINEVFRSEFDEYFDIFDNLHEFRNSLCHIDDTLKRPYLDVRDMLVFTRFLAKMVTKEYGYLSRFEDQFLKDQGKEQTTQVEMHPANQDSAASSSSSSAPQAPSSQSDEGKRKAKLIATPATLTAKSAAMAAVTAVTPERPRSLVSDVYNSDSDEESKKDSKDQTQTDRPKMGRR